MNLWTDWTFSGLFQDFVKIARWNDKNFYAVKAAVHKSHKTLHKHMKQFESVLATSVRSILMENESELEASVGRKGPAQSSCEANFDKFLTKMVALNAISVTNY